MQALRLLAPLALAPAVAALAAAALARLAAAGRPRAADALRGLGLALGFAVALRLAGTRPSFPLAPSDDAWAWVVWIAPAGALLGAALLAGRLADGRGLVVVGAFGTAAAWLILRPLVPHALAEREALVRAGAWGAAVTMLTVVLDRRAREGPRAALLVPLVVALLGSGWILLVGGPSRVMAEAAVALAAAVAATAAVGPWSGAPAPALPRSATPALAGAFVGLLAGGHAYLAQGTPPRFPLGTALLLLAAPFAVLLPRWRWGLAAALACLAGAAALCVRWDEPLLLT